MEITPMQNNQSFGMAFRLQGNGAKKMATSIVESKVPQTTNDFFVNQIIEPIQKLKSEVIYDGEKVLVKNEELKKTLQLWQEHNIFNEDIIEAVEKYLGITEVENYDEDEDYNNVSFFDKKNCFELQGSNEYLSTKIISRVIVV